MASDAKACFSSKVDYPAIIPYLYLKGKTGNEIQGELADVYGSSAPSYAQVIFWVGGFKLPEISSQVFCKCTLVCCVYIHFLCISMQAIENIIKPIRTNLYCTFLIVWTKILPVSLLQRCL